MPAGLGWVRERSELDVSIGTALDEGLPQLRLLGQLPEEHPCIALHTDLCHVLTLYLGLKGGSEGSPRVSVGDIIVRRLRKSGMTGCIF